jgi:NAD(P)-dependent dehydrogenase (short-subunit alcohol dehydrogenase family)
MMRFHLRRNLMKAIVTGQSKGLGEALARELAGRGIAVLGLARGEMLEPGPLVRQLRLDLADSAALAAWLAGPALQEFIGGDPRTLLINNAGVVEPIGPSERQDPLAVARAVALNVAAPLMLTAALARLPGEKRVVHISSGAGRAPYAGWNIYCATKAALDQHARAAALDGTPGLLICSLAPGIIDTPMQAAIRHADADLFPMKERFVALHRDGELTAPAECARQLVEHVLGDAFGRNPVEDLRSLIKR